MAKTVRGGVKKKGTTPKKNGVGRPHPKGAAYPKPQRQTPTGHRKLSKSGKSAVAKAKNSPPTISATPKGKKSTIKEKVYRERRITNAGPIPKNPHSKASKTAKKRANASFVKKITTKVGAPSIRAKRSTTSVNRVVRKRR